MPQGTTAPKLRILLIEEQAAARDLVVLVLSRLSETEWQTNSRVPAGLSAGVHRVRLRTANSRYTEEREIEFLPD